MKTHENFDACGVGVRWMGDDRGYGGVATEPITAGDVLVRVPRAAMLTSEEARACPHVGEACRSLSEWQALLLKLLHERDVHLGLRAVSDDGGSEWGAWLSMLPEAEAMREAFPLLWSKERRSSYLQGSPTLDMLEKLLEVGVTGGRGETGGGG